MGRAWKIAPGRHADAWEMCRDTGCIVLGWRKLGDYRLYESEAAIEKTLKRAYRRDPNVGKGPRAARCIWRFANDVRPKDIVVANDGRGSVVGIGIVEIDYLPPESPKNPSENDLLSNARLVHWQVTERVGMRNKYFFVQDTVWPLEPEQCARIKNAYLKGAPARATLLDEIFAEVSTHKSVDDPATNVLLANTEQRLTKGGEFDPTSIRDCRERTIASIVQRQGQPAFRRRLLAAYNRRCAITGCDVEIVLEAAHIVPYKGRQTNRPANGLLLRADWHTLFDLGLVAVDTRTMTLLISRRLDGSEYEKYRGKPIRVPADPSYRPSHKALEQHRRKSRSAMESGRIGVKKGAAVLRARD